MKDYTKIEDLQDEATSGIETAYDAGYAQAEVDNEIKIKQAYQQGLDDAWATARKLMRGLKYDERNEIFCCTDQATIICLYSASEIMTRIKEYEEQHNDKCSTCKRKGNNCPFFYEPSNVSDCSDYESIDDEIHVGDEVRYKGIECKKPMIVISIRQDLPNDGYSYDAICDDGSVWKDGTLAFVEKTGRHFDEIEKVLKQMQEDKT